MLPDPYPGAGAPTLPARGRENIYRSRSRIET